MIQKVFLGCLLLLLPVVSTAQATVVQKPVVCDEKEKIIAAFTGDQIRERPIWAGVGTEGNNTHTFVVFINEKSGTWTVVEFVKNWGCIVGVGDKFTTNISELISKL